MKRDAGKVAADVDKLLNRGVPVGKGRKAAGPAATASATTATSTVAAAGSTLAPVADRPRKNLAVHHGGTQAHHHKDEKKPHLIFYARRA